MPQIILYGLILIMIIEMNMSLPEINSYGKMIDHDMVLPDSIAKRVVKSMGSFENLRQLEEKMERDYDIEYWLMD